MPPLMEHHGPEEIGEAADSRLLLSLIHISQIYESDSTAAPLEEERTNAKALQTRTEHRIKSYLILI